VTEIGNSSFFIRASLLFNDCMLSRRATIVLCVLTLLLAAVTCWGVAPAGSLPAFWVADAALAAHLISGFALALAVFAAPLIFSRDELRGESPRLHLAKSALAALWLGVASAFMLLAAARVSAVSNAGIAQAALWIAFTAWVSIQLSRIKPHAALGALFFWIFGLPISAYMLAELFLTGPNAGTSLADSSAPQANALRAALHWILNLSPGTAAIGALTGTLADGSAYSTWIALSAMAIFVAGICASSLRLRKAQFSVDDRA